MFLQLLNIERFINENKLLEVKSYRIPFKSYDEDGLWSEVIFGPIGSKTRSERFGYIDLKNTFIHPIVFNMLETVSDETSRIIKEKGRFIVENKKYVEDINGESGIDFLIRTLPEVKLTTFCHSHKRENADYIDSNLKHILINKFLVTPAANRDVNIFSSSGKLEVEEINNLYSKLLIFIQQLTGIPEIDGIINKKIQLQLINLISHIKKIKMTGKKGLFRGTMLKKSLDYTTRLVLTNDPDIELGKIGLPWHTLVAIFEPFVVYHLFKKEQNLEIVMALQNYTKAETFDYNEFSKFVKDLIVNPDIIPQNIKSALISVLNQFLPDQVVMCKRDPVVQRKSWFSATPVITEGRVAYVNSMDLGPLGGDCVKGNIITYTKEKNRFIQHIESIDEFYKNHDLTLIEKRVINNVDIYDFLVNDEVYSVGMNEQNGTIQYSKIQRWSIHNNINLKNILINNTSITISENKSCYVYSKSEKVFKKLSISEVIENESDLLFIKGSNLYSDNKSAYEFIPFIKDIDITDNEIGWFFGLWLGDGYISLSKSEPNLIALTKKNEYIGNEWCNIASKFVMTNIFRNQETFKAEYGLSKKSFIQDVNFAEEMQAKRWGFRDNNIRKFIFDNFGYYCEFKTVPNWVNYCNNEFIFGLVAGLIDSDASIDENKRKFELYSNSKTLLANLSDILRFKFGISSVIKTKKIKYNYLGITISIDNRDFWEEVSAYVRNEFKYNKLINAIDSLAGSRTSYYYPKIISKYLKSKNAVQQFNKTSITTSFIPLEFFKDAVNNEIELNLFKYQDKNQLYFIPANKVKFEEYQNTNEVSIIIDDIKINTTDNKIAYDLTMADEHVRSFLHSSMILQCNSDGDTVAVFPVFTNEAKEEVRVKMNPTINKSKWKDLSSYSGVVYSPSLDAISTVYSATLS